MSLLLIMTCADHTLKFSHKSIGSDMPKHLLHCRGPVVSVDRKGRLWISLNHCWCIIPIHILSDQTISEQIFVEITTTLLLSPLQVFSCLEPRGLSVMVLSDTPVAEFKTPDYLYGSPVPFLRSLKTSTYKSQALCPALEQPNIVTGLPAAGMVILLFTLLLRVFMGLES